MLFLLDKKAPNAYLSADANKYGLSGGTGATIAQYSFRFFVLVFHSYIRAIQQYRQMKGVQQMSDLRIYCSDTYKKLIKTTAVQKGLSVSDFLMGIVSTVIPEEDCLSEYYAELEYINNALATQGSQMTAEERLQLKRRRSAIWQELKKGETQ